jgi:hypothetical protein
MRLESAVTVLAVGSLLAFVQLVASFAGPGITILGAAVIGVAAVFLYRVLDLPAEGRWKPILLATGADVIGLAVRVWAAPGTVTWMAWLSPILAGATAGVMTLTWRGAGGRCGLCKHRIGSGGSFQCPRCPLRVCERTCWVFDHLRCRLCEENRVPILTGDERWWEAQLGPQVRYGRCQVCMSAGDEVDLRACGRCGRPLCRSCWDYANGQCPRCAWLIVDLPPRLKQYMLPQQFDREPLPKSTAGNRNPGRR